MNEHSEPQSKPPIIHWSLRDRLDFRLSMLTGVYQQTTAADSKSVAILLVGGALLTLLASDIGKELPGAVPAAALARALLLIAIGGTSCAVVLALIALIPRLWLREVGRRPLFFAHASKLDIAQYRRAIQEMESEDKLLEALDVEYLRTGVVAHRKHEVLQVSVTALAVAVIALGVLLLAFPRKGHPTGQPQSGTAAAESPLQLDRSRGVDTAGQDSSKRQ